MDSAATRRFTVHHLQASNFQLGMALHPIMDSTSPSHQGFQEWEIFPEPTSYDFYKHIFQEQRISDDQLSKSVELIRQAMDL
jgi:hypothetical protein